MAQIVINEISQNYTYNIGVNSYATVALPITSSWGPGFFDSCEIFTQPEDWATMSDEQKKEWRETHDKDQLDTLRWIRYPATQAGLEAFVSAYRGPATNYRLAKDYSYQMAMTLLTAGYDVLVCRLCPGTRSKGLFQTGTGTDAKTIDLTAKYPGSFGNNLKILIKKVGWSGAPKSVADKYAPGSTYDTNYQEAKTAYEAAKTAYENASEADKAAKKTVMDQKKAAMDAIYDYPHYWSIVTYVVDPNSRYQTAVENLRFTFNIEDSTDTILHIDELESKFLAITSNIDSEEAGSSFDFKFAQTSTTSTTVTDYPYGVLQGGTDRVDSTESFEATVKECYKERHMRVYKVGSPATPQDPFTAPLEALCNQEYASQIVKATADTDPTDLSDIDKKNLMYKEWIYAKLMGVYDLLTDKIAYSPQRIICPWDDQDLTLFGDKNAVFEAVPDVSPVKYELLYLGYYTRCAAALIDVPKCLPKKFVYSSCEDFEQEPAGYVHKLAKLEYTEFDRDSSKGYIADVNSFLYSTHSALFAPWGTYTYVGTGKMNPAPPSFLHLMIHRAQVLNQADQYEWILPVNKKHNLNIGKLDYIVPKHLLDTWQKLEGVGVNVITDIPELGINMWGNSTLFDVPPATYQALANLSTRYLVNAVENVAYKCGIGITFQYNNDQAYSAFYAGVTPILDTMRNVGAITGYYVKMAADINGLDQVNYNSVIGKIYLKINGVINDITVDLVALPPDADLEQYKA